MESVAPTTQEPCDNGDVRSYCNTPCTDVVCSMDPRIIHCMERVLNRYKLHSSEQQLNIQEQYLNKNVAHSDTIVSEVWESSSPDEQQNSGMQEKRLKRCLETEFSDYQHIEHNEHHHCTCKLHKKFKTNPEDELMEPRPPMLVIQTVESSTGDTVVEVVAAPAPTPTVDNTPSDVNTDIPSSVEGSNQSPTTLLANKQIYNQYDEIKRAMNSKIYHKLMVSKSQDLVAKMKEKMPQLSVPLEEYKYDEIEGAMNSKIYHDLTVSTNLDLLAEMQEKMPQLPVPLEQSPSSHMLLDESSIIGTVGALAKEISSTT